MTEKKDRRGNLKLAPALHKELAHYAIDKDVTLAEVVRLGWELIKAKEFTGEKLQINSEKSGESVANSTKLSDNSDSVTSCLDSIAVKIRAAQSSLADAMSSVQKGITASDGLDQRIFNAEQKEDEYARQISELRGEFEGTERPAGGTSRRHHPKASGE